MPVPQEVDMDPNILAFSTICDRLSRIEESTALVNNHLRRQEMCRPHGSLDSALLGFPSRLKIHLNPESQKNAGVDVFAESRTRRPVVDACFASVQCNDRCHARSFEKFYHPNYRRFFPDKAQSIIAYEEKQEDAPRCVDFDIDGEEDTIWFELIRRVKCAALDQTKFTKVMSVEEYFHCGAVLVAKENVDLCNHIQQALTIFQACGHTFDCMEAITITPCARGAIVCLQAAFEFDKRPPAPHEHDQFIKTWRLYRNDGWLAYFRDHPTLSSFTAYLEDMRAALRL